MVPLGIRYTGSQQGCLLTYIAGNYKWKNRRLMAITIIKSHNFLLSSQIQRDSHVPKRKDSVILWQGSTVIIHTVGFLMLLFFVCFLMNLCPFTQVTEYCRRRRVNTQTLQGLLAPGSELTLILGDLKHHLYTPVRVACKGRVFSQGIIFYLN